MSARLLVRAALVAKMESLGFTALEYRDEDDAINDASLPCVLIQQAGTIEIQRLEGTAGGAAYHAGSFFLSFAASERDDAEDMLVAAANALATDYNLGGQVMEIQPVSYGDEDDEGRDFAAIVLEIRVLWATAPDDWATLLN
jgi:hypothetical protein